MSKILSANYIFTFLIFLSANAYARKIPIAEWRVRISAELTEQMCNNESYFMQCYDVNFASCREAVQNEFEHCIKIQNLPKSITVETEGIKISDRIGRCVGKSYEQKNVKSKKNSEVCKHAKNWI